MESAPQTAKGRSNRRKELQTLAFHYEQVGDLLRAKAYKAQIEALDRENAKSGGR